MNEEEQRIKIAEACGWKPLNDLDTSKPVWGKEGRMTPEGWTRHWLEELPDYLNDRNTVNEFAANLTDDEWLRYCDICIEIANRDNVERMLTQAQHCEAFLKTKNLWTE